MIFNLFFGFGKVSLICENYELVSIQVVDEEKPRTNTKTSAEKVKEKPKPLKETKKVKTKKVKQERESKAKKVSVKQFPF